MKQKAIIILLLALTVLILGGWIHPAASAPPDPSTVQFTSSLAAGEGTGITYQGWLTEASRPADGFYDFEFKLYDGEGDPVGPTVTVENLQVRGGAFLTTLDFGSRAFTGEARSLRVSVRPGASTDALTALNPEQPITAAPLALSLPGLYTLPNPASPSLIGGYAGNWSPDGTLGAAIGGGGEALNPNRVTDHFGSIGGGAGNQAGDDLPDPTTAAYASVAGGLGNRAMAAYATVGGGEDNRVSAAHGTVPGGAGNRVDAEYGLAAGRNAWVQSGDSGAFVFADSSAEEVPFLSQETNEFAVRARGGVRLVTAVNEFGIPTTFCALPAGAGGWSCTSDRNAKKDFAAVDGREVLDRLAEVPVTTWSFKTEAGDARHIGPVAQDFYAAFKLGEGDTTINSVDADGVALAAIQGLNLLVKEQAAQIEALEGQVTALEERQEGPTEAERAWAKALLLLGLLLAATSALCTCTLIEIRKLKAELRVPASQAGRRPQA